MTRLPFYLSPCPNDTFITYAMNTKAIECSFELDIHFADVQQLNENIVAGLPCVSKISVATLVSCPDEYLILRTGAAMGRGCGPLLVAQPSLSKEAMKQASIAIPGIYTTARALLSLHPLYQGKCIPMLFSDILGAVQKGDVDMGVIIHESRFLFEQYGLQAVEDLGIFWERTYNLPLPLGIFVIHRSLEQYKEDIEDAMRRSLQFAYEHYEESLAYCSLHAQEVEFNTMKRHIETFVNKYSFDIDDDGKTAIDTLLQALQ